MVVRRADSTDTVIPSADTLVVVDGEELTVSRRHTRELRDLLVRRNRPGGQGGER